MGMLSITFRGPFLFVVPEPIAPGTPASTVTIYAPACAGHLGSVFFGDGAVSLYGSKQGGQYQTYEVSGGTPAPGNSGLVTNTGAISYQWDAEKTATSMILSPDDPPISYTPALSAAYFSITVPRPSIFYALDAVLDTEVVTVGSAPTQSFDKYWMTAFRLYYDWDLVTSIDMQPPANVSPNPTSITPPAGTLQGALPGWQALSDCGDIEFQYQGPVQGDADHRDAADCFHKIAKLAGVPWWLNFDFGANGGGPAWKTGSDCQALPIVLGLNN